MANVPAAWRDLELAEARALDLGWGFVAPDGSRPFFGKGVRIPTFEEVLAELPVALNVDLKQLWPPMVDRVVKLVRARFDAKFIAMPLEGELQSLAFSDLVLLSAKELIVLIRNIGADEIACAFLAVGKRALAEFLSKLSPSDGEELIAAVRRADVKDGMELKAAQTFLGKILTGAPPSSTKVGPNTRPSLALASRPRLA